MFPLWHSTGSKIAYATMWSFRGNSTERSLLRFKFAGFTPPASPSHSHECVPERKGRYAKFQFLPSWRSIWSVRAGYSIRAATVLGNVCSDDGLDWQHNGDGYRSSRCGREWSEGIHYQQG